MSDRLCLFNGCSIPNFRPYYLLTDFPINLHLARAAADPYCAFVWIEKGVPSSWYLISLCQTIVINVQICGCPRCGWGPLLCDRSHRAHGHSHLCTWPPAGSLKSESLIIVFCYGLKVFVPPKFICWGPNPHCNGIRGVGPLGYNEVEKPSQGWRCPPTRETSLMGRATS